MHYQHSEYDQQNQLAPYALCQVDPVTKNDDIKSFGMAANAMHHISACLPWGQVAFLIYNRFIE